VKNIAPVVLFVALLPRLADAQQTDHDFPRTYLFAAPGLATPGSSATLGLGGGIEAPSTPAFLGYSMEVSYLAPVHQFGDGRGLLCFDASHFVRLSKKHFRIEPFIEAGYTRAFGPGSANLANFGGGFNYWIHPDSGIRIEFRDHIQPGTLVRHFPQFRVAYVFEMGD